MSDILIKVFPNALVGVVEVKICAVMLRYRAPLVTSGPRSLAHIYIKIPYLHKQLFNFIAMRFSACANIVNASPLTRVINMYSVLDKIISHNQLNSTLAFCECWVCEGGGYAAAGASPALSLSNAFKSPPWRMQMRTSKVGCRRKCRKREKEDQELPPWRPSSQKYIRTIYRPQ
jgi:hypothetical protein